MSSFACRLRSLFNRGRSLKTLFLYLAAVSAFGQSRAELPRIFVAPQNGFESYISAAIIKKKVPAVVTQNRDEATFVLTSAVDAKAESTGSKIARCLFIY